MAPQLPALRPPPPERRYPAPARAAAVQPVTEAPSSAVAGRRQRGGAIDHRFDSQYQSWQDWARRYVRTVGIARFAASIVADTCSRCDVLVEQQMPNGDWEPCEEPRVEGVLDEYRNERLGQDVHDLVKIEAHHYQVAGEMYQVTADAGNGAADFRIYSARALDFDKPQRGDVTIREVPNGSVRAGTAYVVPKEHVVRFWMPDEEWPAYATSPMASGIEDLHRYVAIVRYMRRQAESHLGLGGKVWVTPSAGVHEKENPDDRLSKVQADYLDMARVGLENDDDVRGLVPPMFHWDAEGTAAGSKPFGEVLDLGDPFDENLLAGARTALEDFARGINMPATLAMSGGGAEQNHWNEWLVTDRFFQSAIAWVMNTITHKDMTATFLVPILRMMGMPERGYRIGYDPGPVIVRPDKSEIALNLHKIGLLGDVPTLEAADFDPDQVMTTDELERLISVLAARQTPTGQGGMPVGPGSVAQEPPAAPLTVVRTAATERTPAQARTAKVNQALKRIGAIRRDVGAKLLARVNQAFADATAHAVRKAAVRAQHSKVIPAADRPTVESRIRQGAAVGPILGALGLTESELLDDRFDEFRADAAEELRRANARQRRALEQAGLDPDLIPADDDHADAAAGFLAAGALAIARTRMIEGPIPTPSRGEIAGRVPGRLVSQTLRIAGGEARPILGETPDVRPTVADDDGRSIGDLLGEQLALGTTYTWIHGAYGEPERPYDPHVDVDGLELVDPELDDDGNPMAPDLAAVDDFTDGEFLHPDDHDGCTCAWDVALTEGTPEMPEVPHIGE